MSLHERARRYAWIAAAMAALALAASPVNAQGLLSRARDEVRDDSGGSSDADDDDDDDDDHDDSSTGHSHSHNHDYGDDDCDGDIGLWIGGAVAYGVGLTLTSPWWGPHVMVDEGLAIPNYFPGQPYYTDDAGYMLTSTSDWGDECPSTHAMRIALEYGHDLNNLQSVTTRLLWEHQQRFGVDGEVRYLQEEGEFLDDELAIGDLNFVYRFAQSERLVMRSGIGINWLIDETDPEAGFNFTYGGDLFPVKPLVISSEIDWGTLGDAGIFRWRGTVGAVWDHVEIYAGYQYYEVEGVPLDGLIVGLRTWF